MHFSMRSHREGAHHTDEFLSVNRSIEEFRIAANPKRLATRKPAGRIDNFVLTGTADDQMGLLSPNLDVCRRPGSSRVDGGRKCPLICASYLYIGRLSGELGSNFRPDGSVEIQSLPDPMVARRPLRRSDFVSNRAHFPRDGREFEHDRTGLDRIGRTHAGSTVAG